MKDKSTSLTVHGMLNVVSPVITTYIWFSVMIWSNYDWESMIPDYEWRGLLVFFIRLLPLVPCPVSCIWGIARSVVNRNSNSSTLCLICSVIGLCLFIALTGFLYAILVWPSNLWEYSGPPMV